MNQDLVNEIKAAAESIADISDQFVESEARDICRRYKGENERAVRAAIREELDQMHGH